MFDPMKDIPETLHNRVKRILKTGNDEEYNAFLDGLASEAEVYIDMKLDEGITLSPGQKKLAVTLFVQYSMFSKTENESIARDKIITLDGLLDACNEKYRESKKEVRKTKRGIEVF